jgi:septum formation protein
VTSLQLVLASASPRRNEILGRLAPNFAVQPADIDETPLDDEDPVAYVERLALEKAIAIATPGSAVIGADTSVVLDGVILGKPRDRDHGGEMLRDLADRHHKVVTGVAVVVTSLSGEQSIAVGHELSYVIIGPISEDRITWYLDTGEGNDKAGGYGLQGSGGLFADVVEGSVSNVIGLPMRRLDELCREVGVNIVADFVN